MDEAAPGRDDEHRSGRLLDEEGLPDLTGPLPEEAATGDPHEGLAPPSDRPNSLDWGTTADEEARGEPLDVRLSHEIPDVGATDPLDDIEADEVRRANDDLGIEDEIGDEIEDADVVAELDDDPLLDREAGLLVDEQPEGVDEDVPSLLDDEKDLVAELDDDPTAGLSAEEAAVHIVRDVGGATSGPDSYLSGLDDGFDPDVDEE